MKQHVLQIAIPEGARWYASDFRQMVGEAHKGKLPTFLFNKDENNRPLNQKPACRFICSRKHATFISERDEGLMDVAQVMPYALQAAQKKFSSLDVNIKTFVVEKGATFKGVPKEYRLIDALKKTRKPGAKARAPEEQIKMLIADELERAYQDGIILDLPEIDDLSIQVFDIRQLGKKIVPEGGEYGRLFSATVVMDAYLTGFWQVGSLTAKGCGRLVPAWKGAANVQQ